MTLATTQSDFRNHMKHYLDMVNDSSEVVYIARSNQRAAAVIDQDKLDWLERHAKANPESLEYAVAEDKLKEYGIIPDTDPRLRGEDYNKFWEKFN